MGTGLPRFPRTCIISSLSSPEPFLQSQRVFNKCLLGMFMCSWAVLVICKHNNTLTNLLCELIFSIQNNSLHPYPCLLEAAKSPSFPLLLNAILRYASQAYSPICHSTYACLVLYIWSSCCCSFLPVSFVSVFLQ